MKRKIGIITFINVNNYGAELQAFALHRAIEKLGHDNEIINYPFYKNPNHKKDDLSKPLFHNSKTRKLKDFVLKWIDEYSRFRYPKIAALRKKNFESFHEKNTKFSPLYPSLGGLRKADLPYEIIIAGSDQIWNPNNLSNLEPYFLNFAKPGVKKISYASSFGVSTINQKYYPKYKTLINNIDHLSTRELSGVEIIKKVTSRDAVHVVDPTLLLDKNEWTKLSVDFEMEDPYILLFIFKKSEYVTKLVKKLKKETGYKVVRVCKNEIPLEQDSDIINLRDLGPSEFLGVFNKAKMVLTTSFHGTIFSLIFQKPFFTITPNSKDNNSRQESLLSILGLESRLLSEDSALPSLADFELDFSKVSLILEEEREKSINFLEKSIKA